MQTFKAEIRNCVYEPCGDMLIPCSNGLKLHIACLSKTHTHLDFGSQTECNTINLLQCACWFSAYDAYSTRNLSKRVWACVDDLQARVPEERVAKSVSFSDQHGHKLEQVQEIPSRRKVAGAIMVWMHPLVRE